MIKKSREKIRHHYNLLSINIPLLGVVMVLLATLLLSIRSILVKLAYAENVAVMDVFYYRFLFALPLLWAFAFFTKRKNFISGILDVKIATHCFFAGFFGYYLATLTDSYALKLIDANISRMILYTFPAYVLLWTSLIKRQLPNRSDILSFVAVQMGLYFVLGFGNMSEFNYIGGALSLVAAISYSLYIVINQGVAKKIGSVLFTTYAVTFSFIFINIHFFGFYERSLVDEISNTGFLIIISMAIFCTFIPLLLISKSIEYVGTARFSLLNTSGPIMTIILCYFILGETLTLFQIIGCSVIVVALYLYERSKRIIPLPVNPKDI